MTASAGLPSLLWGALSGLERAYIAEGAGEGRMPSLNYWANLLRALDEAGIDRRELPAMVRLSKRAVRSRILQSVRNGWVEELRAGRSWATVRLTSGGSDIAAGWKSLQDAAEERWQATIGVERTARLRGALEKLVSALPLEYPHYPAGYGAADPSITGGNGRDWTAVPRARGDTVSHLPLSALISEVIVAFAMEYEEKSPVALLLSTTITNRIPPQGTPLGEFGNAAGIAALQRHGFVRVLGEAATLTRKGRAVNEAYAERISAVEGDWLDRFGDDTVTSLRRLLADAAQLQRR
ncbi:MAG: hypothetical protein ACRD3D_04445 [Terriglobia bacterium]